ncbi:Uncharacterised protein [Vibrio cholerae]|nr:Uncharacterised protein [Vibrio cholerae]
MGSHVGTAWPSLLRRCNAHFQTDLCVALAAQTILPAGSHGFHALSHSGARHSPDQRRCSTVLG